MEYPLAAVAGTREKAAYVTWRDRYASEPERCRRYEQVRRRSPTRRLSGHLDGRMVLRALADLPAGARVLDLPCGGGRISRALRAAGLRAVAADFSPFMLSESAASAPERVRADALRLPFRSGAFDAAVCFRFMQAVPRELRVRTLAELGRVGGVVVASYASVYSLRAIRRFLTGRSPQRNRLSEPQVRSEVEAAGLVARAFHYKARLLYEDLVVVATRRTP